MMLSSPLSVRQCAIVTCGLMISSISWLVMKPWDVTGWMIGAPFGRDYVNFWLAPRLVLAGEGAQLADLAAYRDSVMAAFGLTQDPHLIFVYPPHALLFLVPLALLPFVPAVCLWTLINLGALGATLRFCGARPPMSRVALTAVTVLSPAAVAMVMYGHFGGLLGLGATVAITESERRPYLAGLCLACLTVKPQFAILLGVVLLCSGRWRCLAVAFGGTLALVGLSVAAFGVEPWQRFVMVTMPFQSNLTAGFRSGWIMTSVTPYFSARFFGASATLASTVQAVVAVLALGSAVLAIRSRREGPAMLTAVLLAVIVSQPYASHYDLAVAAPALSLLVLDDETAGERLPFSLLIWLLVPSAGIMVVAGLPVLPVILFAAVLSEGGRFLERRPNPHSVTPASAVG